VLIRLLSPSASSNCPKNAMQKLQSLMKMEIPFIGAVFKEPKSRHKIDKADLL